MTRIGSPPSPTPLDPTPSAEPVAQDSPPVSDSDSASTPVDDGAGHLGAHPLSQRLAGDVLQSRLAARGDLQGAPHDEVGGPEPAESDWGVVRRDPPPRGTEKSLNASIPGHMDGAFLDAVGKLDWTDDDLVAAGRAGKEDVAKALGSLLAEDNLLPAVRQKAVDLLGRIGTKAAGQALYEAMPFEATALQKQGLELLGRMGTADTVAGGDLRDTLPTALRGRLDTLLQTESWDANDVLKAIRGGDEKVVQALAAGLQDPSIDRATAAGIVRTLELSGMPGAATALAHTTAHPNPAVAEAAGRALGALGGVGVAGIANAWKTLAPAARKAALPLLSSSAGAADPRALRILQKAVRSDDPALAKTAAKALADAAVASPGLREGVTALLGDVARSHKDGAVQESAAWALGQVVQRYPAEPASLRALGSLASSPSGRLARIAADIYTTPELVAVLNKDPALQATALRNLKTVEHTLATGTADGVYRAIGLLKGPEAKRYLLAQVDSPHAGVRAAALAGLGSDASLAGVLIQKALHDPSPFVRDAARAQLPALATAGTAAQRRANHAKLLEAAKTASGKTKETLTQTLWDLRQGLPGGPYSPEGVALDRSMALAKAYTDRSTPQGQEGLANLLTLATPGELQAFQAHLKGKGTSLHAVLQDLRAARPKLYRSVLGSLTEAVGQANLTGGGAPAGVKVQKDLLLAELRSIHGEDLVAYAKTNLGNGSVGVLAELGTDEAVGVLLEQGGRSDKYAQERVLNALKTRPPEQVDRVAGEVLRTGGPRRLAAAALSRAGSPAGVKLAAGYYAGLVGATSHAATRSMEIRKSLARHRRRLGGLMQLEAHLDAGHGSLKKGSRARLSKDMRYIRDQMISLRLERASLTRDVGGVLSDPDAAAALATLPDDQLEAVMGAATRTISGSAAGQTLIENLIQPALEGKSESPLWRKVFKGADKTRGVGLKVVKHLAPDLLLKGEKVLSRTLQRALGKSAAEVDKIGKALEDLHDAKGHFDSVKKAETALADLGVKGGINKLNFAFAAVNQVLGVKKLIEDPSFKQAVETASTTKDFVETLAILGKNNKYLSRAGKLAGKVGGPLTIITSALDLKESAEFQDTAGMAFDMVTMVGGALEMTPLAPIGVVLNIAGTAGKWIFGDSADERAMKVLANRYGYLYNG